MPIKKGSWIVVILGIGAVVLLLMTCPGETAVSNQCVLPAGTFSLFPHGNTSSETGPGDKISPAVTLQPQGRKINDSDICISEWNRSAREAGHQRNVTIIPVTDDDFRSFSELQRSMLEVKDKPPANSSEWNKIVSDFNANQSDYYGWLRDSICRNKTRIEC